MGFAKFGKFGYVSQTKVAPMLSLLEKDQLPATRCRKCKTLHFPPRADCQHCRSNSMDWVSVDGSCTLVTFTQVYFPPPQFKTETPYLLGLAELKEGPRVFAPIDKNLDPSTLQIGIPMTLRVVRGTGNGLYYQLQKPL